MCIICIELDRQALTWDEAERNWGELRDSTEPEHRVEVEARLQTLRDRELIRSIDELINLFNRDAPAVQAALIGAQLAADTLRDDLHTLLVHSEAEGMWSKVEWEPGYGQLVSWDGDDE